MYMSNEEEPTTNVAVLTTDVETNKTEEAPPTLVENCVQNEELSTMSMSNVEEPNDDVEIINVVNFVQNEPNDNVEIINMVNRVQYEEVPTINAVISYAYLLSQSFMVNYHQVLQFTNTSDSEATRKSMWRKYLGCEK